MLQWPQPTQPPRAFFIHFGVRPSFCAPSKKSRVVEHTFFAAGVTASSAASTLSYERSSSSRSNTASRFFQLVSTCSSGRRMTPLASTVEPPTQEPCEMKRSSEVVNWSALSL